MNNKTTDPVQNLKETIDREFKITERLTKILDYLVKVLAKWGIK